MVKVSTVALIDIFRRYTVSKVPKRVFAQKSFLVFVMFIAAFQLIGCDRDDSNSSGGKNQEKPVDPVAKAVADWNLPLANQPSLSRNQIAIDPNVACIIVDSQIHCRKNTADDKEYGETGVSWADTNYSFYEFSEPPTEMLRPYAVYNHRGTFCALAENGIFCWGSNLKSQGKIYQPQHRIEMAAFVQELMCFVENKEFKCISVPTPDTESIAEQQKQVLEYPFEKFKGKDIQKIYLHKGDSFFGLPYFAFCLHYADNSVECPFKDISNPIEWGDSVSPNSLPVSSNVMLNVKQVLPERPCLVNPQNRLICVSPGMDTHFTFDPLTKYIKDPEYFLEFNQERGPLCAVRANQIACTSLNGEDNKIFELPSKEKILMSFYRYHNTCFVFADHSVGCITKEQYPPKDYKEKLKGYADNIKDILQLPPAGEDIYWVSAPVNESICHLARDLKLKCWGRRPVDFSDLVK